MRHRSITCSSPLRVPRTTKAAHPEWAFIPNATFIARPFNPSDQLVALRSLAVLAPKYIQHAAAQSATPAGIADGDRDAHASARCAAPSEFPRHRSLVGRGRKPTDVERQAHRRPARTAPAT